MTQSVDHLFARFREIGTPSLIGEVYEATHQELWPLACLLAGEHQKAEDLMQATYLRAMQEQNEWKQDESLIDWLTSKMTLCALDGVDGKLSPLPAEDHPLLTQEHADPEKMLATKEMLDWLEATIEKLDEPYRQVLLLRILEGREYREIAEMVGRTEGTIRSQVKRGLERLRPFLPATFVSTWLVQVMGSADAAVSPPVHLRAQLESTQFERQQASESLSHVSQATSQSGMRHWGKAAIALPLVGLLIWFLVQRDGVDAAKKTDANPTIEIAQKAPDLTVKEKETGPLRQRPEESAPKSPPEMLESFPEGQCAIAGKVYDPTGRPMADIPVRLFSRKPWRPDWQPEGLAAAGRGIAFQTTTDALGAYRFDVPTPEGCKPILDFTPGPSHIGSRLWLGSGISGTWPVVDGKYRAPDVYLPFAASVRARVLDTGGRPVPGVKVNFWPGDRLPLGHSVRSDKQGWIDAQGLLPGKQEITLTYGCMAWNHEPLLLDPDQPSETLTFYLPDSVEVPIRVRDAQGKAVGGVQLTGVYSERELPSFAAQASTDDHGEAILRLALGSRLRLLARHTEFTGAMLPLTIEANMEPVEFALQPIALRGLHVLASEGTRLPKSILVRVSGPKDGEQRQDGKDTIFRALLDSEGSCIIPVNPGDGLAFQAAGFQVHRQSVPNGTAALEVNLVPEPKIIGRVVHNGAPVQGARLEFRYGDSYNDVPLEMSRVFEERPVLNKALAFWTTSGPDGRFAIEARVGERSELRLLATHPQLGGFVWQPEAGQTILSDVDVGDLELLHAGHIEGHVLLPEGAQIPGLAISLGAKRTAFRAPTDHNMNFVIKGVPAGEHQLQVEEALEVAAEAFHKNRHAAAGRDSASRTRPTPPCTPLAEPAIARLHGNPLGWLASGSRAARSR